MWPLCPSVTAQTEGGKVASLHKGRPTNPRWPKGSGPPRLPSACHMVTDGNGGKEPDSSACDNKSTTHTHSEYYYLNQSYLIALDLIILSSHTFCPQNGFITGVIMRNKRINKQYFFALSLYETNLMCSSPFVLG